MKMKTINGRKYVGDELVDGSWTSIEPYWGAFTIPPADEYTHKMESAFL